LFVLVLFMTIWGVVDEALISSDDETSVVRDDDVNAEKEEEKS